VAATRLSLQRLKRSALRLQRLVRLLQPLS
jgi:hypothetical protein